MALTGVLGQSTAAGQCPQAFLAHQQLDAMQIGVEAFGQ